MAVGFKLTPSSAAASAVFVENQNVRRGVGAALTHRVLLIGQYNSGESPTDNVPQQLLSVADAQDRYGRGSMLATLAEAAFRSGAIGYEVFALPVADDGSAVAATGEIEVTGSASANGTLALTIAGTEVDVAVSSGDSATDVGDAIESAINAKLDLPVTASNSTGTVTVTARFEGAAGNQISMDINRATGDVTPAGLTVNVDANLSSGATNPTLTTALGNLGDTWFTEIVCPYLDDTSITAIESTGATRMGPTVKRPFIAFVGYTDTQANLLTALDDRNSEFTSYIPVHGSPTTAFEISAAAAGWWARKQVSNVGRPVYGDRIPGVLAGDTNDLTYSQRDTSVKAGGSYTINSGSSVLFGDVASTRTETDAGVATTAYRFVSDYMPGLQLKINDLEITYGSAPFSQATVIDDAAPGGVPNAVRPATAKAYAIQLVDRWAGLGLTKNRDDVVDGIVSEINSTNAGRIDVSIPDDFALGLRIMAALIEWDS
jgi:phage tail sheath gpL-like